MRRSRPIAVALLLAAFAAGSASAASAQEAGLTARMASGAELPFRAVVVGLPSSATLGARSVHVYENGDPVTGVTVIPASSARIGQFGVVLVIDTSDSMHGDPVRQATTAAGVFASKLPASTKLAIVAFNSTPHVLLPFTSDRGQIASALATPPALARGTHIYDAVQTALGLIRDAKVKSASIVVLSDGADTGSAATEASVAAAARRAGVTIYTVGLKSGAFDSAALNALAYDGRGSYTEADSPDALAGIYDRLGQKLANQYVIRYRTLQPAGASVKVAVKIDGFGVAQTAYSIPGTQPGAAFHRSPWTGFWRSIVGMVFSVLVAAALIGLAVAAIFRPRKSGLRARVGQFVSVTPAKGKQRTEGVLTARLYAGAERSLGSTGVWTRFKEDLELAEITVAPSQIVLATLLGVLVVGWLIATLTGFPVLALVGLAVVLIPRSMVATRLRKRRNLFSEQLPDNLQVMASAMRAGHSFIGALAVVVDDAPEPSSSEFRRVVADEQFGVSLEDALRSAVRRMDNRDLAQVALVAALQRETGGNTAEVLERVTETIRGRFELRRLVKTLTAQGRMSRWVVSLLPVALLLIISLLNPNYMDPLFTRPLGRLLLVGAAGMVIAGSLVIKKIVDIKV